MSDVKRCLVMLNHFGAWTGAEVSTLELAEWLAGEGWRVSIHAVVSSNELREAVKSIIGMEYLEEDPDASQYDLLWLLHYNAARAIPKDNVQAGMKRPWIVCSHLSPHDPLEGRSPVAEPLLADFIAANSEETAAALRRQGVPTDLITVVPNPAPERFFSVRRGHPPTALKRLLLVSNHPPKEVNEAIPLLEERGIRCSRIGLGGAQRRLVPEDVLAADAVVTIGKTVQYALATLTPVYCYDLFGGPGWITPANLDSAAWWNFSGRSDPRKLDCAALAEEIQSGFAAAATSLMEIPVEPFRMENSLGQLVSRTIQRRYWTQAELVALRACWSDLANERTLVSALQREVRRADAARIEAAALEFNTRRALELLEESRQYARGVEEALAIAQKNVADLKRQISELTDPQSQTEP